MAKTHADKTPKTRPGVTGFVQEYNQEPGPRQDLNPDVVTEDSVLPEPLRPKVPAKAPRKVAGTRKGRKAR
jgi:hypothetical protein